jgi:hypothetical protein
MAASLIMLFCRKAAAVFKESDLTSLSAIKGELVGLKQNQAQIKPKLA